MTTGVKAVDQLIEKFGILSSPGQDKFQRLTHFYLPYKNCKLASFMFNEKGELIEQVYFTKMSRMVNVCRKLQRILLEEKDLREYASQGMLQQGKRQKDREWAQTEQFAA